MAQILKLSDAVGYQAKQKKPVHLRLVRNDLPAEDPDDFWLEASRGLWSNESESTSDNSPGRVLSEMAMVLGGTVLLVLLSIVFFRVPYA